MDTKTLAYVLLVLVSWGGGAFIEKLATGRIGSSRAVFWDILARLPIVVIFSFMAFKSRELFGGSKEGIFLALVGGIFSGVGLIGFFLLLGRKDASSAVPLAALYPVLTSILAFIFLKEPLTIFKGLGIVFATLAIYLLSL